MKRTDVLKNAENELGYTIFLPNGYSADKAYPMILSLHGAGERGNGVSELDKATNIGIGKYIKLSGLETEAIVLCPQCPCDRVWNQLVFELGRLVERIADEYRADKKRISVTGMSMGGFGTWELGLTFPERFSALAPICGGGMAWRTGALKGKPIWAFHGNADPTININNSIEMVTRARECGADVKFTIFDGVGHNSWDMAYLDTKVIDWLTEQSL